MATINNADVIKSVIDKAKINTSVDKVPSQLAEKIIPILDVNPLRVVITSNANRSLTGNSTLYTTNTKRKFFLTSAYIQNQSNAACDNTEISLNIIPKGKSLISILKLVKITLTVFSDVLVITFKEPIELEPETNINFGTAFTLGASTTTASIFGYEVEE